MSAAELLEELEHLGIKLDADGDRLRYWPCSSELGEVLKPHKVELLAILRVAKGNYSLDASAAWQATLDRIDGNPVFPVEMMNVLRSAIVHWADEEPQGVELPGECQAADERPVDCIDPDDVAPCPKCGSFYLWENLVGEWRCQGCDPPTAARRLRAFAASLRARRAVVRLPN